MQSSLLLWTEQGLSPSGATLSDIEVPFLDLSVSAIFNGSNSLHVFGAARLFC